MDNRWSDSLRQRLEAHGETPPGGLWDAIEQGMDSRVRTLARRRRNILWGFGSGAAAAVATLFFVIGDGGETGVTDYALGSGEGAGAGIEVGSGSVAGSVVASVHDVAPLEVPGAARATIPEATPEATPENIPAAIPEMILEAIPAAVPEVMPEDIPEPSRRSPGPPAEQRPAESHTAPDYEQYLAAAGTEELPTRRSRKSSGWQTGLFASNISPAGSGSRGGMQFDHRMESVVFDDFNNSGTTEAGYLSTVTDSYRLSGSAMRERYTDIEHRLPVTVGLSVGYGLSDRWSLTSGLTYTRLASTYKTLGGINAGSRRQVLHYIGIPIDVKYDLWQSPAGLSVYLSAGGQAAKSVSGRVTRVDGTGYYSGSESEIDSPLSDRVQWSVRASAGLGWDFTSTVGIYAEPGVDYQFDNRSGVVTVWKDRPLNFGLRLGLRLSL